jgi:tRNA(Ile)-lysidine synthase
MGLSPAVAAVRVAVRGVLDELPAGSLVLAACSGGADSTALAAALAFEAPRSKRRLRAGAITIDHGLQAGSAERAESVAGLMRGLGLNPVEAVRVDVGMDGGPEAAARAARYAALDAAARRDRGAAGLLGHTLDDQAETVLLRLARGSGTRSIAGMAPASGPGGLYRRPLLAVPRQTTRKACADAGLPVWDDPHNADPAYARSRLRTEAMDVLEATLGPGIAEALARTAALARDDADALDAWAATAFADLAVRFGEGCIGLDVEELVRLPVAVRRRVLRLAALSTGASPGALGAVHIAAIDALVADWRGRGPVSLPGGGTATREPGRCGRLYVRGAVAAG